MRGNTYIYNNIEFHSIRALAKYAKVNEKTITARLRRGMTVDQACEMADFRCSYYGDGSKKKSISEICKEQEKDAALVKNRLKYGYSLEDALNRPKKITRQGIPIVVKGILYHSIASALDKLEMRDKESTIRRRLKEGRPPDEAFSAWQ